MREVTASTDVSDVSSGFLLLSACMRENLFETSQTSVLSAVPTRDSWCIGCRWPVTSIAHYQHANPNREPLTIPFTDGGITCLCGAPISRDRVAYGKDLCPDCERISA